MADDPVAQVLTQNALIADALYDLVQFIDGMTLDAREAAILQDAKTKVNALNPYLFTFGQPAPVQRQRTMYDAVTP